MANLKVRGDDDVLALLNEMTGDTVSSIINDDEVSLNRTKSHIARPNTNTDEPLSRIHCHFKNAHQLSPPSNPHVEIIRHRCHEKFKTSFYDAFRSCVSNPPPSRSNNDSSVLTLKAKRNQCVKNVLHTIWKEMPPHSIWERYDNNIFISPGFIITCFYNSFLNGFFFIYSNRYQFSLKTLEAECIRDNHTVLGEENGDGLASLKWTPPWCQVPTRHNAACSAQNELIQQLICPTVHQIHHWIVNGRLNGILWEPLLPVPSISESNTQQNSQKFRHGTSKLLREEIEFQFRRSLKQHLGSGGRRAKDSKGISLLSLSFDQLFSTLKEFSESIPEDYTPAILGNREFEVDTKDGKEEFILAILFSSPPFHNLLKKLTKKFHFLAEDTYSDFLSEMRKYSNRLAAEDQKQHQRHGMGGGKKRKRKNGNDIGAIPKITFVDDKEQGDDRQAMVSFGGVSLRINEFHLNKLKLLFEYRLASTLNDGNDQEQYFQYFPQILFTTLLRYDSLEGAGLQSAIPPTVFRFLNNRYNCDWECFASPFNCWLEQNLEEVRGDDPAIVRGGKYGCAFGDTDGWFGGAGNFFGSNFLEMANESTAGERGGCFQANPPFASNFIESMSNRMDHFLASPNEDGTPLMFIIFVPAWKESTGWKTLMSSSYLTKHVMLSQKEDVHYYSEGTQHRRRADKSKGGGNKEKVGKGGTHRIASFDTSVFFLQNNAASKKWPLSDDDEERLKSAFAMVDEDSSNTPKSTSPPTHTPEKQGMGPYHQQKQQQEEKQSNPTKNSNKEAALVPSQPKHKSKKSPPTTTPNSSNKKKTKLMSGGSDELGILESLGILNDDEPSDKIDNRKKSGKHQGTAGSSKKTKKRHKKR